MKRHNIIFQSLVISGYFVLAGLFLSGCASSSSSSEEESEVLAMDVYTQDEIVDLLLFEETADGRELRHRRSVDGAWTWIDTVTVDRGGREIVGHHRGMDPQIAASGDTVVVLWTMPGTSSFGAGPMATAVSHDGGTTWVDGPNPADDGSTDGHGFYDLIADEGATLYAAWLDSRDGAQGLRTAVSQDGGQSWSANASPDTRTCECCWNKVVALGEGSVGVLYRDKDPRDMALATSDNGGASWFREGSVGTFGWEIEGCPHVGGGIARAGDGENDILHATVWTGKGGEMGVYALRSEDRGESWSTPVRLGSPTAKHTDVAAAGSRLAAVWDESGDGQSVIVGAVSLDNGRTWGEPVTLSDSEKMATHPRVVWTGGRFVAFWTERGREEDAPLRLVSGTVEERGVL